jgi:aminoacyl tRNA synthase complex-interacting multifunctional protein 1
MSTQKSALELLETLIAELESSLAASAPAEPVAASTPAAATAPAPAPAQKKEKKENNKAENKGKKEAAPAASTPAAADEPLNINGLDLRVGIIRAVRKHDTAEKLYCEEIDVGEEAPRAIASGLVPYYTLEEMQDRRLIVVCNLKPRNLVGFKSHGMVLCASTTLEDGTNKVEFVDPPVIAKPGDRIIGEGLTAEALTMSQCDKKKAFEVLAADLKVDADGFATWKGIKLVTANSGEVCTVPTLRDCHIK